MDDLQNLHEEIFCLKYELNALAEGTLQQKAERWIPGFIDEKTDKEHWDRYKLACLYSKDKTVLDIACGVGKGSYMLATMGEAKGITACDIQELAIRYAKFRNRHNKISYSVQNAELYCNPNAYDLVVSFETIEHLSNYNSFLQNVHDSLKTGGIFLVSTPISDFSVNDKPVNPYHIQEWGFEKFQEIISEKFTIKKVYTQLIKYEPPKPFVNRTVKRIFNSLSISIKGKSKVQAPKNNFLQMEEFKNQYEITQLGVRMLGYQTILCEKA